MPPLEHEAGLARDMSRRIAPRARRRPEREAGRETRAHNLADEHRPERIGDAKRVADIAAKIETLGHHRLRAARSDCRRATAEENGDEQVPRNQGLPKCGFSISPIRLPNGSAT